MKLLNPFVAAGFLAILSTSPTMAQINKVQPQPQLQTQPGSTYSGISQTPWFGDPAVRQQFKWTPDQYNALNKAHSDAWAKYNYNIGQLGINVTPAERAKKINDIQANYYQNLDGADGTKLPDDSGFGFD
jgi:hypothetical protein